MRLITKEWRCMATDRTSLNMKKLICEPTRSHGIFVPPPKDNGRPEHSSKATTRGSEATPTNGNTLSRLACYPSGKKKCVYVTNNSNKVMSICANYWKVYGNEFARPYVLEMCRCDD